MNATCVYDLLQKACLLLEDAGDHAIAAYVGLSMAMVHEKYGVGHDHRDATGQD